MSKNLEIKVELEELSEGQEPPKIVAYIFNRSGKLLDKRPIDIDAKKPTIGRTEFELEETKESLVVKIGPEVEDINFLEKYQPMVKPVPLTREKNGLEFKVPKILWGCWLKVPYLVLGDVKKDGTNAPICFGEVEIYDVDRKYCFLRIPDAVIEWLRDAIIDIVINPPPIPPGPQPDPPRRLIEDIQKIDVGENTLWPHFDDEYRGTKFPPRSVTYADIIKKLETLPPKVAAFAKNRLGEISTARRNMSSMLQRMSLAERSAFLNREVVEGVKISQIIYSTTSQFRALLIDKFHKFPTISSSLLCELLWMRWRWLVCEYLEKLGTAQLQPDGSFSKIIWLPICRRDQPDLWFVVRQDINGVKRVIYEKDPVPCHTYWDHPSGEPVHLVVTDPNAITCIVNDPVDKPDSEVYVMPLGIGWDGWYQIDQNPSSPTRGLYRRTETDPYTDPYGDVLDIQMQFHKELRNKGIMYYRWSYRKENTTDWVHINTPITHRYLKMVGGKPYIESKGLGPHKVGSESDLFEIPDPECEWVEINREDRRFAAWDTRHLPDGKYELKLEMFDGNGNKISDPTTKGFKYFLPKGRLNGVWDVDDNPHVEDGSIILHIHIDNTHTVADIKSVALNTKLANECQFLEYQNPQDLVNIEYAAYHPNGFLHHYDLVIKRGISGTPVVSKSSNTPAYPSVTENYTADHLLRNVAGSGPFSQCAFAVELHTWPRTRDGYSHIRAYEAYDTSAFALVPKKT